MTVSNRTATPHPVARASSGSSSRCAATSGSPSSLLVENRRPLPEAQRPLEQAVLGRLGQLFASFQGSRLEAYDAMTALTPIADGVTFELVATSEVRGIWARPHGAPRDRALLFVHGGAYMLGSAQAYRGLVSQIAVRAGCAVFSLDYPLAPEQPFPAAYDAAVAARRWLDTQGLEQVALVGDSCGGGLVLATLGAAMGGKPNAAPSARVASVVVFSPWVDLGLSGASATSPDTHDPIFQLAVLKGAVANYLGATPADDPRASPLHGVAAPMPPLLVQVGTDELLLDDARRYAALAAATGAEVQLDVFEGVHHVFQRAAADLPMAALALDEAAAFVVAHWRD